jgi:hypothetical protein
MFMVGCGNLRPGRIQFTLQEQVYPPTFSKTIKEQK